ncbi:acyl carrier protein [Paenibacillus tyrfis]|uniref:acyl carrier protein n=1 Tax=Paenibacillus tyrfis TaxID=1501230 RepID=UPI00055A8D7C|nr:acyl carrier protein [Paenibacillus tyrfis]
MRGFNIIHCKNANKIADLVVRLLELDGVQLDFEQSLFALGLNSLKTIILLVELEEAFDITYDDGELIYENFSSLRKITTTINEKLKYREISNGEVKQYAK